jgi:hypothetical protein
MLRFQCPECGLSDYEVGHLFAEDEVYCVACLVEEGRHCPGNRVCQPGRR